MSVWVNSASCASCVAGLVSIRMRKEQNTEIDQPPAIVQRKALHRIAGWPQGHIHPGASTNRSLTLAALESTSSPITCMLIPTARKPRVGADLSYPIGAERLSSAIGDLPQAAEMMIYFATPNRFQQARWRFSGDPCEVLALNYRTIKQGISQPAGWSDYGPPGLSSMGSTDFCRPEGGSFCDQGPSCG